MNQHPLSADIDRTADRITNAVLGLSAIAVFMLTLGMYLTA